MVSFNSSTMLINWTNAACRFSVISKGQQVGSGGCKKRKRERAAISGQYLKISLILVRKYYVRIGTKNPTA